MAQLLTQVDSDIANVRAGESYKLALVAGISHDFLVARHGGVEDDLSDLSAHCSKPHAVPDTAIL